MSALALALLAACPALACFPALAGEDEREASAELPLARAHGLAFVELGWNERTLLALVDTGANASAVDARVAAALPALGEGEIEGTTGTLRAASVALEGLRFGALRLPTLRATRRPLEGLLAPEGRRVELVLGSDAFLGRALRFDFARGRLALGPSAAPRGAARADAPLAPGEARLGLDQGIPTLEAVLGGLALELRIDSGASLFASDELWINVPLRVERELRARGVELLPCPPLSGTGANGETLELAVWRLRAAPPQRLGPLARDELRLIVQPEAGYFARPDAKGFVGLNLLEKLGCVTLDYGAGRLRACE